MAITKYNTCQFLTVKRKKVWRSPQSQADTVIAGGRQREREAGNWEFVKEGKGTVKKEKVLTNEV